MATEWVWNNKVSKRFFWCDECQNFVLIGWGYAVDGKYYTFFCRGYNGNILHKSHKVVARYYEGQEAIDNAYKISRGPDDVAVVDDHYWDQAGLFYYHPPHAKIAFLYGV